MSRIEKELDRFDVAKILEDFLQGAGGPWDWDDFNQGTSPLRDSNLEAIRRRFAGLGTEFPPDSPNKYCGNEGFKVLQSYVRELRRTG